MLGSGAFDLTEQNKTKPNLTKTYSAQTGIQTGLDCWCFESVIEYQHCSSDSF